MEAFLAGANRLSPAPVLERTKLSQVAEAWHLAQVDTPLELAHNYV